MSAQDDGGSAFPGKQQVFLYKGDTWRTTVDTPGMSLRDWFAGQALAGIAAVSTDPVKGAYRIADAMLAARSAKP